MTEMTIIKQQEVLGKDFKIYGTFEEPLMLAKDVAEWLEYSKTGKGSYDVSRMLGTLEEDEKVRASMFVSGQRRNVWFITEPGLYELLLQSRKPIAKAFRKEVMVILKNLRKHGVHMTDTFMDKVLEDPDEIIRLALRLKESRARKAKQEELKNNTTTEGI